MKYLLTLTLASIFSLSFGQNNAAFRLAVASELEKLKDGETLLVEYKKTGDWGDYEGGYLTFTLEKDLVRLKLTNTNQYNKPSNTTTNAIPLEQLLAQLRKAKDRIKDPDNVVINNYIHYHIKKNNVSIAMITSTLEPDQVINKVQLNSNFSDFFNKEKNKKAGILINN